MTIKRFAEKIRARLVERGISLFSKVPSSWEYMTFIGIADNALINTNRIVAYIRPTIEGHCFIISHLLKGTEVFKTVMVGKFLGPVGPEEMKILAIVMEAIDWSVPETCILED